MSRKVGIFVGRMCPIHSGHQKTIDKMIEDCGIENCMVILGSVSQKVTFRVLFDYHQRRNWIERIYGYGLRVVGVPDFPNNDRMWIDYIGDIIGACFYGTDYEIVFYGGSTIDIEIFHNNGYATEIVDRSKVPVSATVIRDMMLRGMNVSDFLDRRIHDDVVNKFARVMEESEKWETPF